jgi:hypothetical protein
MEQAVSKVTCKLDWHKACWFVFWAKHINLLLPAVASPSLGAPHAGQLSDATATQMVNSKQVMQSIKQVL